MAVNWRWLNWGVGDCSGWEECNNGCWLKRAGSDPQAIGGYIQDVPVLCRYRQIDEPIVYYNGEGQSLDTQKRETWYSGPASDFGRDPGSHVTFARKFRLLDIMRDMHERGRPVRPGLKFHNHRGERFLIAHWPGYSVVEHYPALMTFQNAEVSLPDNVTIVTFATENIMDQAMLIHQLERAGIPYVNAATGIKPEEWENARKPEWLCRVLPTVTTDYVLVLDSLDVLLCGDLDPLIERFETYETKVLFGATKHPHPKFFVPDTGEGSPDVGEFSYLNAGTALGRTGDVLAFYQRAAAARASLDDINERRSEQLIIRAVFAENTNAAAFDHRCSIFQLFGGTRVQQIDDTVTIS